jgi:hypothetical protein
MVIHARLIKCVKMDITAKIEDTVASHWDYQKDLLVAETIVHQVFIVTYQRKNASRYQANHNVMVMLNAGKATALLQLIAVIV